MKVLVIGSKGSMGRRYMAILKYLEVDHVGVDVGDKRPEDYTHAIVATPTAFHMLHCKELIREGTPFLCEKPLCKDIDDCRTLSLNAFKGAKGYVVGNYNTLVHYLGMKKPRISYNYYNHGKDDWWWDMCQLIYLDPEAELRFDSPVFHLTLNNMGITYWMLEKSYIQMVEDFLNNKSDRLWSLDDGVEMTRAVVRKLHDVHMEEIDFVHTYAHIGVE